MKHNLKNTNIQICESEHLPFSYSMYRHVYIYMYPYFKQLVSSPYGYINIILFGGKLM